jgi:hypothetical protein
MIKVQTDIFHLVNARIVLRKTLAFCGLVSILLTASCAPTPSNSGSIPTPEFEKMTDSDPHGGIQVSPEEKPQAKLDANFEAEVKAQTEAKPQSPVHETPVQEIKPEPTKPVAATPRVEPGTAAIPTNGKPTLSTTSQNGGGGAGDAGGGSNDRPTDADIRATIARLSDNYIWSMLPTFIETYRDPAGKRHNHLKVTSGSKELSQLLLKINEDLRLRKEPTPFHFEIREHGPCDSKEEKKAASAKMCDKEAPICLSLENIKAMTPKATLEQSLKSLIMHEVAHQNCANEDLAKQVERYYDLPAIKNYSLTESASSAFNRLRVSLLLVKAGLTTGIMPYQGKEINKVDTKEQICSSLEQGAAQAEGLQGLVGYSGFVVDPESKDPHNPEKIPRVELTDTLQRATWLCKEATLDRVRLLNEVNIAIKIYDQLAQEFSKNSHWIIYDFSKHLWPYWNDDEAGAE